MLSLADNVTPFDDRYNRGDILLGNVSPGDDIIFRDGMMIRRARRNARALCRRDLWTIRRVARIERLFGKFPGQRESARARKAMTRRAVQLCPVTSNMSRITRRPADLGVPFAATGRLIVGASPTSIGRWGKPKESGPLRAGVTSIACVATAAISANGTRTISPAMRDSSKIRPGSAREVQRAKFSALIMRASAAR